MSLKIFWTPAGINLDQIGSKRFVDLTDGDTVSFRMNVRMLSIDTPESAKSPGEMAAFGRRDAAFNDLADWLASGDAPITQGLAQHLIPRLARDRPASIHAEQGQAATDAYEALIEEKLGAAPNRKNLFVRVSEQPFDRYGRLLAYVAPNYSRADRERLSLMERATFNLLMIENGWAAPFILYPNVPGELDLPLAHRVAREAEEEGRGAFADPLLLLGYEYRAMARLADTKKKLDAGEDVRPADQWAYVYRYCADMTTGELFPPQDYWRVKSHDRLFVWRDDVRQAVADLNLVPAAALSG